MSLRGAKQAAKLAGYTHVHTAGGPVTIDQWQPYGYRLDDCPIEFEIGEVKTFGFLREIRTHTPTWFSGHSTETLWILEALGAAQ